MLHGAGRCGQLGELLAQVRGRSERLRKLWREERQPLNPKALQGYAVPGSIPVPYGVHIESIWIWYRTCPEPLICRESVESVGLLDNWTLSIPDDDLVSS